MIYPADTPNDILDALCARHIMRWATGRLKREGSDTHDPVWYGRFKNTYSCTYPEDFRPSRRKPDAHKLFRRLGIPLIEGTSRELSLHALASVETEPVIEK